MKENKQDFKEVVKKESKERRKSKKLEERQQAGGYPLSAVFAIV